MARADKPHVLLIDDNDATCALVMAILRRDFAIDTATDGAEAIEKLKTNVYAVILLDLRMPQVDGFGVLDFLHGSAPEALARVIVLTAAVTPREMGRVRDYPIASVIVKPFDIDVLLNAVKACSGSGGSPFGSVLSSGMILLIADLLRQKLI